MQGPIHCDKYDVTVGPEMFGRLDAYLEKSKSRKILLVDTNTKQHCLPLLQEKVPALQDVHIIVMEAGEENKSLPTCEHIWNELTNLVADRNTLLVNLGGGVVCDTGGFAASVYNRGVRFIHLPTTLLSMVDSSVGGKTGINFAGLKNQVGTFCRPDAVFISSVWLKTLPQREIRSGFAEMIKHALVSSHENWQALKSFHIEEEADWIPQIRESVILKNCIVQSDFHDVGQRKILNFGHTIGHSLESTALSRSTDFLRHGEAVALGMIGEVFLSQHLLGFPEERAAEIVTFLLHHYPGLTMDLDATRVMEKMKSDKKNENGSFRFVLLRDVGEPVINAEVSPDHVIQALDFITEKTGATLQP